MNRENPKVTVRMSAYNHEAYVEQAILSIVNQTYQDFELLVIDDGSTDRTPEILERLSQEHGFYYERQQNMGLPKTLNKLIRMANGEYITGCASDDYWPEDRLEEQVAILDHKPRVDLVHGNFTAVDGGNQVIPTGGLKGVPLDGPHEFPYFVRRKRSYSTCTIMVRTDAFHRVGLYDETISVEDFDWMLRATRILNIHYSGKPWVFYRRHGENWTRTSSGAVKLADASYQEAKELGFYWGSVFIFYKANVLLRFEMLANRKRRFFFLLLLPVLLFNRAFVVTSLKCLFFSK